MDELPREVLLQIIYAIGPIDACRRMGRLCKTCAALAADDWLWHRFCLDAQQRTEEVRQQQQAAPDPSEPHSPQFRSLSLQQVLWAEWAQPKEPHISWKQHFIDNFGV